MIVGVENNRTMEDKEWQWSKWEGGCIRTREVKQAGGKLCVREVGGGGTFEVKACTQERLGFGGVKRMNMWL
jgi:hypothetical protein